MKHPLNVKYLENVSRYGGREKQFIIIDREMGKSQEDELGVKYTHRTKTEFTPFFCKITGVAAEKSADCFDG